MYETAADTYKKKSTYFDGARVGGVAERAGARTARGRRLAHRGRTLRADASLLRPGRRVASAAMADYLPILVMAGLVVAFVLLSFIASQLLAPQRPNAAKQAPYECGIVPEQEPAERFPVKFYLVAMSFIVLDVEIVFLYPFSVVFRGLGVFGLVRDGGLRARAARAVRVPAVGRRARVGSGQRRVRTPARSAAAHRQRDARPDARPPASRAEEAA